MAVRIQLRRDTAANWTSENPILAQGEIGIETDADPIRFKIGDGVTEWADLDYFESGGGGGAVDSVNGQTGVVVLDADDVGAQPVDSDLSAIAGLTPSNDDFIQRKAGAWANRTVAQVKTDLAINNVDNTSDLNKPVSTATTAAIAAAVTGLWDDRGNFDASINAYPSSGGSGTAGAILKGDIWTISVAGTLPTSLVVAPGDTVRALVDTPGNTQANWAIAENNIGYAPVQSVSGDVVDNTDPINPTINKADILNLPISRTITDSDSLEAADVNSILDVNIGTNKTLTVTTQPSGSVFYILRRGAGELTFVESGVTITPQLGALTDGGEDSIVTLIFTSTTTALLQNGAPVSISSSDIIAALGYTPANEANAWSPMVIKGSNQTFNTASVNTWGDITGLSFPITAGQNIAFRGMFYHTAANSTEGYSISINGPTLTRTTHTFTGATGSGAITQRPGTGYDGTTVNSASLTPGGSEISGMITCSANGTVTMRLHTEGNSIDVTILAGSWIQYKVVQ